MKRILILFLILFLIPSAHALRLSDNIFFTVPENGTTILEVVLPDDLDYFERGEYEYEIVCIPDEACSSLTGWGDFTEQIVRKVSDNNTVIIPIEFSSKNNPIGACSLPFSIIISSEVLGLERTFKGGVCVSEFSDSNSGQVSGGDDTNETVVEGLSDVDVFSIGLKRDILFAEPGGETVFELYLESYADMELDITVDSALSVDLSGDSVSTSSVNPFKNVTLLVTAPQRKGTYRFTANVKAKGCSESFCMRAVTGTLKVQKEADLGGFEASIFPNMINRKSRRETKYKITIKNHESESRFFLIEVDDIEGLDLSFDPGPYEIGAGREKTVDLIATPFGDSNYYEIRAVVRQGDNYKPLSAVLKIREMSTDAARQLEMIRNTGNSSAYVSSQREIEAWESDDRGRTYGSGLSEYGELRDTLNRARQGASEYSESGDDGGDGDAADDDGDNGDISDDVRDDDSLSFFEQNKTLLIIVVVIVAVVILVLVLLKARKGGGEKYEDLSEEF